MYDDHDFAAPVELLRARRLKRTIEQFWADRGRTIEIECVSFRTTYCPHSAGHWNSYKLVSNTVNGWPVAVPPAAGRRP